MFDDKETCCFMQFLKRMIYEDNNYLLPVKDYENIKPDKNLLGYYDNEYIYIIPSAVVGSFGIFCSITDLKGKRIPVFKAGKALINVINAEDNE